MMRLRGLLLAGLIALLAISTLFAFQRQRFRSFEDEEDNPAAIPPDAREKTEYAFARLRYPSGGGGGFRRFRSSWPTDYPKADRQFVQGVRRLTRIHTRSMEEVVDLDSDEIYKWPWIYAVEVGTWGLTDSQVNRLRDYLLRGGFLMTDDYHGGWQWEVFMDSMNRVFPDRPVVEIDGKDAIFHVLYDLDDRVQVPGIQMFYSGRTYERDGVVPHWRGIYDDKNRLMVAMCFNQDNGDAWEWADHPRYPENYASQAYRMGINFIIYAMTH